MSSDKTVTVLGGGLAGALMALYLGRAGYSVELFEKRPDPRLGKADSGRSINLALSTRGIHALRDVGALEEVMKMSVPMRGRMIHGTQSPAVFQSYGSTEEEVLHSVSRLGLNLVLLNLAGEMPSVRLHFGLRCEHLDLDNRYLYFKNESGESVQHDYQVMVGADGAFSAARSAMQKLDRFNYDQHYIEHGYKELCIPAANNGSFAIEPEALHIWPRGTFMMIALPNKDGSFTCTLFWPFRGPNSFEALQEEKEVERFFRATFPDAVPLMPTLAQDFVKNPVGSLLTVRSYPWHVGSHTVLVGDACHAVLPFYGQGMNAAFEDCTVLMECLRKHGERLEDAFREYETKRKEDVDTLAQLAYDNFIEMRDKVTSPVFRLWKQVENALHAFAPQIFVSLHGIVSFTKTPYAAAVKRVKRQNQLLAATVAGLILCLWASL